MRLLFQAPSKDSPIDGFLKFNSWFPGFLINCPRPSLSIAKPENLKYTFRDSKVLTGDLDNICAYGLAEETKGA